MSLLPSPKEGFENNMCDTDTPATVIPSPKEGFEKGTA